MYSILYAVCSHKRNLSVLIVTKTQRFSLPLNFLVHKNTQRQVWEAGTHSGKLLISVVSSTLVSSNIVFSLYYWGDETANLFIISAS